MDARQVRDAIRSQSEAINLASRRARLSHHLMTQVNSFSGRSLSMDTIMQLEEEILWPTVEPWKLPAVADVDAARAQEYSLLSLLLARSPDAAALHQLAQLGGDGTPLGLAHSELAQVAQRASAERLEREFFTLFIGVGRGELLPYTSYYLTGFLNERPLARLRADLHTHGIEHTREHGEPEDHAAVVCEIMAGLVRGNFETSAEVQRLFFEAHVATWMDRFFADLEQAEAAEFYRHVAKIGRLFLNIETEAFALQA